MSTNPISLRLPSFDLETPEGRIAGHRYVASGIVDLNQAIPVLKKQIDALTAQITPSGSSSSTTAGVTSFNGKAGVVTYFPELGTVNDQTGSTAYTTQSSDSGALLILNDASPVAVLLNTTVAAPWFVFVQNQGAGVATFTPQTGTISYLGNPAAASMPLGADYFALIVFDGTNFLAATMLGGPGGSNQQIQYNNAGVLDGAPGGLTDGEHFAFGDGASVDGAPASFPDGTPVSQKVIQNVAETYAGADLENGQYIGVTLNPSAPPSADTSTYGSWSNVVANGPNWASANEIIGSLGVVNYVGGGGTGPAVIEGGESVAANEGADTVPIALGAVCQVANLSTGNIGVAHGTDNFVANEGGGTVSDAVAVNATVENDDGTITDAQGFNYSFISGSGTTAENDGVFIQTPNLSGGALVTLSIGVNIQEQNAVGVGTAWQIYSPGASPSYFAGPIQLPYTQAQTVYSVAGTPLPAAATAGMGARAFVSDATVNTFAAPYVGSGTFAVPVYSDGTGWFVG